MTRVSPGMWQEMENEVFKGFRPMEFLFRVAWVSSIDFWTPSDFGWFRPKSAKIASPGLLQISKIFQLRRAIYWEPWVIWPNKKRLPRNILFYHPPKGFCWRIRFRIDKFLKILRPPPRSGFWNPILYFKKFVLTFALMKSIGCKLKDKMTEKERETIWKNNRVEDKDSELQELQKKFSELVYSKSK